MPRCCVACLLLGVLGPMPVNAEIRFGGGVADEIDGRPAGVATVAWLSAQRHPWELMGGYIAEREPEGAFARVPEAYFVAVGRRLHWQRWSVSASVAWVSVDNHVLSGHGQFLTGLAYDFGRARVGLRHMSNAGTNGRNRGETFAVVELEL